MTTGSHSLSMRHAGAPVPVPNCVLDLTEKTCFWPLMGWVKLSKYAMRRNLQGAPQHAARQARYWLLGEAIASTRVRVCVHDA